jgi:uncharacterized tellurite resistance protein B-like protein
MQIIVNRPRENTLAGSEKEKFAIFALSFQTKSKQKIMGLFDAFKSEKPALTPKKALTVSVLYVMAADGELDPEEVGLLFQVAGINSKAELEDAIKYVRSTKYTDFLEQEKSANLLSKEQKMYILTNMTDSSLSDGTAEPQEQAMILKFMEAFGISDAEFKPYVDVIVFKNNRKLFS